MMRFIVLGSLFGIVMAEMVLYFLTEPSGSTYIQNGVIFIQTSSKVTQ